MKESWRIGRVAGIGIYLHVTFPLLVVWLALSHYQQGSSWFVFAADLLFVGAVFGFVVLHELGHALMARRFGIRTRDITLLPIGGVAHLEKMPERPVQELAVALAGPAVNGVIAGVLALAIQIWPGLAGPEAGWFPPGGPVNRLLWLNVAMAGFNLIPAFPMDGGRVLRALLALRLDYVRATTIAATIGQALAVVAGFVGIFANPFLVLIAIFVWMGAAEEARTIRLKSSLAAVPVECMSVTHFDTLTPDLTLREAAERMRTTYQPVFPVVADDVVIGMLSRAHLLEALAQRGGAARVESVLECTTGAVEAGETFEEVLPRLRNGRCPVLPVLRAGRVIGLLGAGSIGEYLRFHDALEAETRRKPPRSRGRQTHPGIRLA